MHTISFKMVFLSRYVFTSRFSSGRLCSAAVPITAALCICSDCRRCTDCAAKSAVCRSVNTVNTRRRTYIMGTWEGNIINIINSLQSICTCIYTKSLYRGKFCFVLWPSFSPLLIFILRSFCCYRGCASRVIIASQYYPC